MVINIFIILALIAVTAGSYTDLKTLEVPDWINYSLIAVGLALNVIFSIYFWNPSYIYRSLFGFIVSVAFGLLMFYTGQWGGGDSKMLFGLGALLGLKFTTDMIALFNDFYFQFLINWLFAGALYGMLWIIVMAIKNTRVIMKKMKKAMKDKKYMKMRIASGIACVIALLLIYFLPSFLDIRLKITMTLLIVMLYFMNYALVLVKIIEEVSMVKMIPPEKLTEGD